MVKWQFPEITPTFLSVEFSKKKKKNNKKQSKNNNKNQTPNILEIRTSLYIIYVIFRQKLLSDFESEGI